MFPSVNVQVGAVVKLLYWLGREKDVAGSNAWFSLSLGNVVDAVDVSLRLKMRVRSFAVSLS